MKKVLKKGLAFLLAAICFMNVMFISFPEAKAAGSYEKDIFYFLKHYMGMNDASACGVVANIEKESSFRPDLYGDNGTSYGICQWHNSRFDDLKAFCGANGYDYKTVTGQLFYLKYELETFYPNTLRDIKSVENTEEGAYYAAYSFCYNFERPANREYKSEQRGELAKSYWKKYGVISGMTPQKLNNVNSKNEISSAESFTLSWKAGEGKYNRNRLHIVPQYPSSVSYDWGEEQIIITSLNTLKYTVKKGELSEGKYLVWVEPWYTVKEKAGESSSPIIISVTDELFYEVESVNDAVIYDASKEDSVEIYGWAVNSGRYVTDVYYSLDGDEQLSEKTARADISSDEKYAPFCKNDKVGFSVSLPLSDLSNGKHSVTLTAKSESVTEVIGEMTFEVINGHDHSFKKYKSNNDATYLSDGTKTAKCDLCNTKQTVADKGTKLRLGVSEEFTAKARDNYVSLSWAPVKDAAGYRVYIYDKGWQLVDITDGTSFNVLGLTNNQKYRFALKAYGIENEESFMAPSYVTASATTTPSLPTNLKAVYGSDKVTLSWGKAEGATGYRIYEYNEKTKSWDIFLRATHKTEVTLKDLTPGTYYNFAVRPYFNTGEEIIWSYSFVRTSFYTKLATPEIKVARSSAKERVTISWSKSSGAAGYQVWCSTNESSGFKKASNYKVRSTYIYGFESGKTYYLKVRAYKKTSSGYIYSDYTPVKAIKIK